MANNQYPMQYPAPAGQKPPQAKKTRSQNSSKKAIVGVLSVAIVVVVALIVVAVVYIIQNNGADDSSAKYMELANNYLNSGDYESAISNYWVAIDLDPYNEEPYIDLGEVYEDTQLIEEAYSVYRLGYERIGSARLRERMTLIQPMIQRVPSKSEPENTSDLAFNKSLALKLTGYTFGDFRRQYGEPSIQVDGQIYTVTYTGLPVQFLYYNTDADRYVINELNGKPMDGKRPNEISVDDLSLIFSGMGTSINMSALQNFEISTPEITENSAVNKVVVRFMYNYAVFEIECSADGSFNSNAWNRIYPGEIVNEDGDDEQKSLHILTGVVRDATTARGIFNVTLSVASKGNPSVEITSTISDYTGGYKIEDIEAGDYIITASAEGYISDQFFATVFENGNVTEGDITLSPVLSAGAIRIVLTWNATPQDLDSYLIGSSSDGTSVYTYFQNQRQNDRSGNTIAELDVDDMDGYGPETTTLYDTAGNYTFSVQDYGRTQTMGINGATVRIYIDGQSSPIVVECPPNVLNVWNVCTINNGVVNVVNTPGD
ncbi:MAG: carboxypeptidase regulatory-like domain-containing protein [Oscillospiraceae bacterium]|nr:carboxypeptidase regulatory-like domain-containing protein [Oscillospiraceae bacterium]